MALDRPRYEGLRSALSKQHPGLIDAAVVAQTLCNDIRSQMEIVDDIYRDVDEQVARRVVRLSQLQNAMLILADSQLPAASLALARTAIEHHLVDVLIMHAERVVERRRPPDGMTVTELKDRFSQNERCLEARVQGDEVVAIWRGIAVRNGAGEVVDTLSPYMVEAVLDSRPPVPKGSLEELDEWDHSYDPEYLKALEDRYYRRMRWESILSSLRLDSLLQEREIARYRILYAYLSQYSHSRSDEFDPFGYGRPDLVYGMELAVLLALSVGLSEIEWFWRYVDNRPGLTNPQSDALEPVVAAAWREADHLWYPTRPPHRFDFVRRANTLHFSARKAGDEPPGLSPEDVDEADVQYQLDLLHRLKDTHRITNEILTGYVYQPPWSYIDH